jgi:DNA-directed RNA polymerase sigma subunit (sigma70/sigma32)
MMSREHSEEDIKLIKEGVTLIEGAMIDLMRPYHSHGNQICSEIFNNGIGVCIAGIVGGNLDGISAMVSRIRESAELNAPIAREEKEKRIHFIKDGKLSVMSKEGINDE